MEVNEGTVVKKDNGTSIKSEVQAFYDEIGWQEVSQGVYQNASYEDLRPVSREYIHRCHLRVKRYLKKSGKFLLDAGSGPIQYPEYLEYSGDYLFRVCVDISAVAVKEARKRIGKHGLFVVADVANLPFKTGTFDGAVSLHTIHHLPEIEHVKAYQEIYRVLADETSGVVVNGWKVSPLMQVFEPLVRRLKARTSSKLVQPARPVAPKQNPPTGTFVNKNNAAWLKQVVGQSVPVEIYCWRSISVGFMRALIHPHLGGRFFLRLIYWLEELAPNFMGEKGQYPLVVIRKTAITGSEA